MHSSVVAKAAVTDASSREAQLGARLAPLSEAERTALASLTVWWNQLPRELELVELDDEFLLKILAAHGRRAAS